MLELTKIKVHEGSQSREQINQTTIDEYMDAIKNGAVFPPVIVFFDSVNYWLADGWHRFLAHQKAGIKEIHEEVRLGTHRDATLYSLGANDAHGLRRSNADKRKAIMTMLNDEEWSKWSNEHIAKSCKVSPPTVADARKAISKNLEIGIKNPLETTTACRNGKVYEVNTANIGRQVSDKKPVPPQEPENEELPYEDEQKNIWIETIQSLEEQITTLKDGQSVLRLPESEQHNALEELRSLRAKLKTANVTIDAITKARDDLMLEVAQLKRQCIMQAKELKKLKK